MNSTVRKLGAFLPALWAAMLWGQGAQLPKYTVATLPNPVLRPSYTVQVIDGANVTDCIVGGGTFNVLCVARGSGWAPVAAAAGNPGELQWNNNGVGGGTTSMTWSPSLNYLSNPNGSIAANWLLGNSGVGVGIGAGFSESFLYSGSGLSAGQVACATSSGQVSACPAGAVSWIGITQATGTDAQSRAVASLVTGGQINCIFDNKTAAGDYVQVSTTVAGDCHDAGTSFPTGGSSVMGQVLSINAGPGAPALVAIASTGAAVNPSAVVWPSGCNSGSQVYSPSINGCINNGTANNPAGTAGQMQFNRSGVFGAIPGSSVDSSGNVLTFTGQQLGGMRYAAQYGDKLTNGIASATAPGQTIIADPSYPSTERFIVTGAGPISPPMATTAPATQIYDYRGGSLTESYRDMPVNPFNNYNAARIMNVTNYVQTGGYGHPQGFNLVINNFGPGVNFGSRATGNPGPVGMTTMHGLDISGVAATAGILSHLGYFTYKTGIGDDSPYFYNYSYGGQVDGSAEGNHWLGAQSLEPNTTFKGTVASGGGGANATTVKVSCTVDCNSSNGGPGDGRFLIDTATVLDSGNITANSSPNLGTSGVFTIDHSVTPSNADGTLTGDCNNGNPPTPLGVGYANPPVPPCVVTLNGGTGFVSGPSSPLVCFSGVFHEQTRISSITGTGPYTLIMPLRHVHKSGDRVMQGGPCGTYIDLTFNDVTAGMQTTLHYPFELIGAQDATHLNYAQFFVGVNQGVQMKGLYASYNMAASSQTNVGGTVYFNCGSCGLYYNYPLIVGGTAQFSGSSDSAYDGACTNVKYNGSQFSCTQASSVGHGLSASATVTAGTSRYGNGAYVTWAGAEVLDVLDYSVNPPVINNNNVMTFTTEPNIGAWANTDAVEQTHHYALEMNGLFTATQPINPMTTYATLASFGGVGAGFCCANVASPGSSFGSNAMNLNNNNPANIYQYHGGYVLPPGGITMGGLFQSGLNMIYSPDPINSAGLYIGCPVSGCTDPNFYYSIWQAKYQAPNTVSGLSFRPYTNSYTPSGNWNWSGVDFAKETFRDQIVFGALAVPTLNTPTTSTTGGSLADATPYYYTVYATNNTGSTVQSAEKTVTTGTSGGINSINLVWSRSQGAISYTICRSGTTGTELKGPTLSGMDTVVWLDNGSQAFSGACSTADTTLGYISNASKVTYNSSGTAFAVTVQAPAGQASNTTVTLPSTTGNLPAYSGTPTVGKATCWKTATTIGYCSTQPDSTGSCTCN